MKKLVLLLGFLWLQIDTSDAQIKSVSLLVSGPMLGYVENREVLIWMEVTQDVKKVHLLYNEKSTPQTIFKQEYKGILGKQFNPIKILSFLSIYL